MAAADLLLHPIRIRLIQAFLGGRELTAAALAEALPDVPRATLYRHLGLLVEGGVLRTVDERRVRGATERTYALVDALTSVSPEEVASATPEDHVRWFTTFVAGLIGDFARYVARPDADFLADGAGYRQVALWLSDKELRQLLLDLNAVVAPRLANAPRRGRQRRVLSTILVPAD